MCSLNRNSIQVLVWSLDVPTWSAMLGQNPVFQGLIIGTDAAHKKFDALEPLKHLLLPDSCI